MDAFEICALIFAILICLSILLNFLVYLPIYDVFRRSLHVLYLYSAATTDNLAVSIVIMVGACLRLSSGIYKACMIVLIITDVIFFLYFIICLFLSRLHYFDWVDFIKIAIITPLIIFIDKIKKKREMIPMINPGIATGSLIVEQNDSLPNNNKPGYVQKQKPNVSNAYPPPS